MLKEYGIAVALDNEFTLVQMQRSGGCMNCVAHKDCGVAGLSLVLGKKNTLIKVTNLDGVKVGDKVMIGLDEQALLKSSLVLYLLPLVSMFAGIIGYDMLVTLALLPDSEILTVLASLIGLFGGLKWVKLVTNKFSEDMCHRPIIVK